MMLLRLKMPDFGVKKNATFFPDYVFTRLRAAV